MKRKTIIFLFFLCLFIVFGNSARAFNLEALYPKIPGVQAPQDFINTANPEDIFPLYIRYIYTLSFYVGAALAALFFILGGIQYLLAYLYFVEKPEWITSAKERMTSAIFGLLLLASSYLIFGVINPQLQILSLPKLNQNPTPVVKKEVPGPDLQYFSSINVELPFGRIVAKIFENYISDVKPEDPDKKPRFDRIEKTATDDYKYATEIKDNIKKIVENISDSESGCKCDNANPQCDPATCLPKGDGGCDCDACKTMRKDIEKMEKDNLKKIGQLKEKKQDLINEVKDINSWLDRLDRNQKFLDECNFPNETSLLDFLNTKSQYESANGEGRQFKFWDDVPLYYLRNDKNKTRDIDYATFMCLQGGTILNIKKPEEATPDADYEAQLEQAKICPSEAPVGEIGDRTKRIVGLLTQKLEKIIGLNNDFITAVDQMNVLISKCSSRPPNCVSKCVWSKTLPPYCVESCEAGDMAPPNAKGPCPFADISSQFEKIKKIIKSADENSDDLTLDSLLSNERPKKDKNSGAKDEDLAKELKDEEKMGIFPLIKEVIPDLLIDLEVVRTDMAYCDKQNSTTYLIKCNSAKGYTAPSPDAKVIYQCCQQESFYQDCLAKCYLKINEEGKNQPTGNKEKDIQKSMERIIKGPYRDCLAKCLDKKSDEARQEGEPNWEVIKECRNSLNFYCCEK